MHGASLLLLQRVALEAVVCEALGCGQAGMGWGQPRAAQRGEVRPLARLLRRSQRDNFAAGVEEREAAPQRLGPPCSLEQTAFWERSSVALSLANRPFMPPMGHRKRHQKRRGKRVLKTTDPDVIRASRAPVSAAELPRCHSSSLQSQDSADGMTADASGSGGNQPPLWRAI